MPGSDRNQRAAWLLRTVGALLLTVGGLALVLRSLTWGRDAGTHGSDLWAGLVALVAGVLFGLPVIRARLRR
jgi:UPF0716 family protein affecting phage T7 exclusion